MSVINQMLKDLQQRQGEQSVEGSTVSMPITVKKTPYKNVLLVIGTVALTLGAVYVLKLYDENKVFKQQSQENQQSQSSQQTYNRESNKSSTSKNINTKVVAPVPINNVAESKGSPQKASTSDIKTVDSSITREVNNKELEQSPRLQDLNTSSQSNEVETQRERISINQAAIRTSNTKVAAPSLENKAEQTIKIKPTKDTNKIATGMVISRTQLTPEMLAKQKMNRAKEAVANNDITKAEQLFEDVLLVLPSQKDARKQLAALWFGRQSYQAAVNLLSQGINLDPMDLELRILKAQIYIQQGQNFSAFKILQSHPNVKAITDSKYQSMLATQAQASQQFSFSISAYQRLTELEANVGRWWLGLAIAYDSNSQFKQASQTYTLALKTNDLSDSARQFITQRLQELGE